MRINEIIFKQLYEDNFEIVCRFLNNYTHDTDAIQEVVQDMFVHLWEERDVIDITYFKTYLYNGARNRILNHLRNETNRNNLLQKWAKMEIEKCESTDCVDIDEFFLLLQAAVDDLPSKCKDIYVMKRDAELSYKEIAIRKNISVKTVETQMGIALKRIREYMVIHYAKAKTITGLLLLNDLF